MAKLRRILLKGIDSDEKLDIVSRCARMLVELGKRDPKVRDLAVHVIRQCKSKDQLCEAKIGDKWYWITYFHLAILEEGEAAAKVEEEAEAQDACRDPQNCAIFIPGIHNYDPFNRLSLIQLCLISFLSYI
jgi:hypothetical protein